MQTCELPITLQQNIKSYTWYALPLCIVFSEKKYYPWIYKNFIQVKSSRNLPENGDHLAYCFDRNYDEVFEISHVDYPEVSDLLPFLENHLLTHQYLHCELDEYYVEMKASYKRRHFIHPSLLYGYDRSDQVFHAIGFISGNFKKFPIPYSNVIDAVKKGIVVNDPFSHAEFKVSMYTLKPINEIYPFPLIEFRNILEHYLFPSEGNEHEVYGFDIYRVVLSNLNVPFKPDFYMKYNTIHFLAEHKKTFQDALNYVLTIHNIKNDFLELYQEYAEVAELFERIRMLHLKLALSDGNGFRRIVVKSSADRLIEKISAASDTEKIVLSKILEKLEHRV